MRRSIAVFAAVAAATLAGFGGVSSAAASTFYTYAGYQSIGHPPYVPQPPSGEAYANIDVKSLGYTWGHAAAWLGVDDGHGPCNCSNSAWIQAGVFNQGQGLQLYIEYKVYGQPSSVITPLGAASFNTNYTAYIYDLGNGVWQAYIGGQTLGPLTLGSTMIDTQWTTEVFDDTLHYTSEIDAVFSSMYPWGPSVLSPNTTNNNDEITKVTGTGFESIEYSYNPSCYPNRCNVAVGPPSSRP